MEQQVSDQITMEQTPLNSLDRCDRCGAQAYVRALLVSGGELTFCAHHGKEYAEGLKTVAARIQDETTKLVEQSAN
jgi:hypothetical protein